ncbi:MAG: class I SAM-dependent methyltransferase [Candidatus Glassbacteria bacterium]|nr:class I SAM-dependent methyltransferase [Candidatus Glassbacteria bacterium]
MKENEELMQRIAALEDHYWWYTGRRKILKKVFGRFLSGDRKVLNIGCGTGGDSLCARTFAEVFNTDYSLSALVFNRSKGNTRHFRADCLELPVKSSIFDMVLCLDVLEHLEDDERAVAEISRVLAPGSGRLLVTVPALGWLWTSRDEVEEHFRRYSKPSLEALLRKAGFGIIFSSYFNTLLFPLTLLDCLLDRWRRTRCPEYSFPDPGKAFNLLLQEMLAFERHFIPRPGLPFGKSLICLCRTLRG